MDVRPVTVEEAVTLAFEPEAFVERFGLALVEGWDEPGTLEPTVEALEGGVDPRWLTHLLVECDEVVGMGGFTGPPQDGEVEVGYHVAPARRGRGLATAAVDTWVSHARRAGLVRVVARTAPGPNASTTVLARCGFVRDTAREDEAATWWWVRPLS
ncbi:GNAT family N-acetyltransferase [Actinomycetospora chiangmaiensis]|uniref:GNAT family N-acetyltransferase n=1 Tax=Actinomycetospora chiangmaiensis TaxID=402650 RepID=UPI000366C1ED|nr:GNAT family N-acetyltransferase [Actinomycetospora chiangmaiensis]